MKHLTSTISATIAAGFLAFSAPASAADIFDARNDALADPVQAQVNWSGLWVGAVGGYHFSNTEANFEYDDVPTVQNSLAETFDANVDGLGMQGFIGEAQIGFDKQVSSNLLIGVFGGYGINDAEFEAGFAHTFAGNPAGSGSLSGSQDWHAVLGARVGLIKSDDTMFYFGGGWALGELDSISLTDSTGTTTQFAPEDKDLSGWFAELGAEHRLVGNVYGTFMGRYTDYGSNTILSGDECFNGGQQDDCSYALTADKKDFAIMLGLKAKLGGF